MDQLEAIFHQLGVVIREIEQLVEMIRRVERPLRRAKREWPFLRDVREIFTPCQGPAKDRLRRFDVVYRQAGRYLPRGCKE